MEELVELQLSTNSKIPYIVITTGLTFIVSGFVFFMISAGLPGYVWIILGGLCLALGAILLALGISCWFSILKTVTGEAGWQIHAKEETEAFTLESSDDACVL